MAVEAEGRVDHLTEHPVRPADGPRKPRDGARRRAVSGPAIAWFLLSFCLLAFIAFGRVTVYDQRGRPHGLRITRVWMLLGDGLPRVNHATLLRVVFYGSLILLVVTSILGFWLALAAGEEASPVGTDADGADLERLRPSDQGPDA